ncbi:MAG: hypothetical protein KDD82_07135, partial [Planctomycetes bacterium]|nr:hypothetical protein [Planctomycetota bacterium]
MLHHRLLVPTLLLAMTPLASAQGITGWLDPREPTAPPPPPPGAPPTPTRRPPLPVWPAPPPPRPVPLPLPLARSPP